VNFDESRTQMSAAGLTLSVTRDATVIHESHASTRMLGSTETERRAKVWLYRVVVFLQAKSDDEIAPEST
jgi:hypothetical protein